MSLSPFVFSANGRIIAKSSDIRDLMTQYYAQGKELPVWADGNWHIIPEQAFRTLKQQAFEQAKRTMMR